ncbi:hypothetical protein ABZX92_38375 [Lentzea sp. NPDC006480]|uniref:hypothetical protein n=1 Tax=Lentzea sp. NPDC006480 TaxID=3157176 RepID=UPI0033BE265D
MRAKGIAYDTGFVRHGEISVPEFDLDVVARDLRVIRDELHCNAVHLIGGSPERLEQAARIAASLGLEVWFSPYPLELDQAEILELFVDCARRAERVRAEGAEVVFVAGVELTIMNQGFVDGDDVMDRVRRLVSDPSRMQDVGERFNEFMAGAVKAIRAEFAGLLTYACIHFERVDWSLFDIMAYELIRSAQVADQFPEAVRSLVAQGKPVAITGFGTAAWRGSGAAAPSSMGIVENDEKGRPVRVNDGYVRDEGEQAVYLRELLEIFEEAQVDGAFVYMFALNNYTHRPDEPSRDFDMASPGIVKVYDDGHWEPKLAFHAVAEIYARI